MLKAPADGLYLKNNECKEICNLIFGDIRDVEYNALKEKILKSQQQVVKYAKIISDLRIKLEEKEKELISVYDSIDNLNQEIGKSLLIKYKSPIIKNSSKYSGESTGSSINPNP